MKSIFVCILALVACMSISASPVTVCPPSFTTDGIEVTPGCPGLTYRVVVEPGTFMIDFNDNPLSEGVLPNGLSGDGDADDGRVNGVILASSDPTLDEVLVAWGGALSAWNNEIFIGTTGIDYQTQGYNFAGFFAVGSLLPVSAVAGDGETYYGDPSQNPGRVNHFYESQVLCDPTTTPEPNPAWLVAVGTALLLGARIRRKKEAQ